MGTACSANGRRRTDWQTATLNCEISTMWETKPRRTPRKGLLDLMGLEQATRAKTLQAVGWWWWSSSSSSSLSSSWVLMRNVWFWEFNRKFYVLGTLVWKKISVYVGHLFLLTGFVSCSFWVPCPVPVAVRPLAQYVTVSENDTLYLSV